MNKELILPENYIIDTDDRFSGSYTMVRIEENITPQLYLKFAINDLESNLGDRSNINAFSNAKRAIHFQTDLLSKAFGIKQLPEKKRDNFPKKIDYCEKCGIVGKRILKKFNYIRNKIEHDYYLPQFYEVENVIDVAELFLAATSRFFSLFPFDMECELNPKSGLDIPTLSGIGLKINDGILSLFQNVNNAPSEQVSNLKKWQDENAIVFRVNENEQYFKWVASLLHHSQ